MEELEADVAELSGKLGPARESLERLRIARETVAEVLAEVTPEKAAVGGAGHRGADRAELAARMGPEALPRVYRDIIEVVADVPGPGRAKQIVPRIGLPAETGKIEGTRSKLKRLVERG
ncbi:hypothetical protein ABZ372_19325 [Streptomyces sp. NPDC005921]|uniref:hypothetical protein n=1 Tax=Streptomyces sp. NPDC005827 TaxID=3157070 RepID=UPI0033DED673